MCYGLLFIVNYIDNFLFTRKLHQMSNMLIGLQYMGHNPTFKEVNDIIEAVDTDNTGEIEFEEFVDLMQKIKDAGTIGRT